MLSSNHFKHIYKNDPTIQVFQNKILANGHSGSPNKEGPQDLHILIPGNCECYLLIWLRVLKYEDYAGLPGWALNPIISVLLRSR